MPFDPAISKRLPRHSSGPESAPPGGGGAGALSPGGWPLRNIIVVLCLLGILVYGRAVRYPFVHDDHVLIVQNPVVESGWRSAFVPGPAPDQPELANAYYRPLLDLVILLQRRMFGLHPAGYHLTNIVLHILNAVLLLVWMTAATGRKGLAAFVSAVFLVHPVQSEAVAAIAGISNLLMTTLGLCVLLCLIRARRERTPAAYLWLTAGACCYGLTLMTKEQGVVFCGLALLQEWGMMVPADKKKDGAALRSAVMVILTAGYLLWRRAVLGVAVAPVLDFPGELWLRITSLARVVLTDLRVLVWPADVHYYRSLDVLQPVGASWGILAGLGLLAAVVMRRLPAAGRRMAAAGMIWFVVSLLPVLPVLPLIHEYSWVAVFDHFLYLPLIGFFWAAGAGAASMIPPGRSHPVVAAMIPATAVIMIATGAVVTFQRVHDWRGDVPLFQRAVRYEPGLARVQLLLAQSYLRSGHYTEAEEPAGAALRRMEVYIEKSRGTPAQPVYAVFSQQALEALGRAGEGRGELSSARAYYHRALEVAPPTAALYNQAGTVSLRLGDFPAAQAAFERGMDLAPDDVLVMNNLAICLLERGEVDAGRALLKKILAIDPAFTPARGNLQRLQEQLSHE